MPNSLGQSYDAFGLFFSIMTFYKHFFIGLSLNLEYCSSTILKELFGQLEYNMRNIFFEKSHTECCGETISGPFFKKNQS